MNVCAAREVCIVQYWYGEEGKFYPTIRYNHITPLHDISIVPKH